MEQDRAEVETFVQLMGVEGGLEFVGEMVLESITDAKAHLVDVTIDLNNREAYNQLLEAENND